MCAHGYIKRAGPFGERALLEFNIASYVTSKELSPALLAWHVR